MAFFHQKEDAPKETLFQKETEEDLRFCQEAQRRYETRRMAVPDDVLSIKILETNERFSVSSYCLFADGESMCFFPFLPSKYTTKLSFSLSKLIDEMGADAYCSFMDRQTMLRIPASQISVTLEEVGFSALPKQQYPLITRFAVQPFTLRLEFADADLSQAGPIKIQISNQPASIQFLNRYFPQLHLLSFYNILEERQENVYSISSVDGFGLLPNISFQVWREDDELVLFHFDRGSSRNFFFLGRLPLDIIEYYRIEGDLSYENKISGGGGGGSDYGKAVVGGLLFGVTGAIIASRNEINEIQSQRIEHDYRVTVMSIFAENQRRRIIFTREVADTFHMLIPEKDYDTLSLHAQENRTAQAAPKEASIPEQILQLAQLKDIGLLTEEEFTEAKQALLAKLKA